MTIGLPPKLPNGQVTTSINGLVYRERSSLLDPTEKAEHLRRTRGYPAGHGGLVKPIPKEAYRDMGSLARVQEYKQQMHGLRAELTATGQRASSLIATPARRSPLKKFASAAANGAAGAILVGLLSRPGHKPDINGALQTPFRPNARKGNGKSGTAAELLGETNINERKGSFLLEHAGYLYKRAEEQAGNGPRALSEEFNARLEVLQPRRDAVHNACMAVKAARAKISGETSHFASASEEREKEIAGLEQQYAELGERVQELKNEIRQSKTLTLLLEKGIVAPHEEMRDAEDEIWKRISLYVAASAPEKSPDENVRKQIQEQEEKIAELKKKIATTNDKVASNTQKVQSKSAERDAATQQQQEIQARITPLKEQATQETAATGTSQLASTQQYEAAIADLKQVLESLDSGGSAPGEYRQSLNDHIAKIRSEHGVAEPDDAGMLALAEKIQTLLDNGVKELRFQLDDPDSDLQKDFREAYENLTRAEKLVGHLNAYLEDVKQAGPSAETEVAAKIASLNEFVILKGTHALRAQLTNLFERLSNQPPVTGDQLDNKAVFDLVYSAASDLGADPEDKGNPALAAKVLEELMAPGRSLRSLMEDGLSKDTRELVQAIAVLPRGMEVLKRIVAHDEITVKGQSKGKPVKSDQQRNLDAIEQTVALYTWLRAGNELARLERSGTLNDSTQQLLQNARIAARKRYDHPGARLEAAECVAYSAVRNRLSFTGPGSYMEQASDRLQKFANEWIDRGLERSDAVLGRIGQGCHKGTGRIKNLATTTGKSPLTSKTLAAADKTSPAYAAREFSLTGNRLDVEYLTKTGNDIRQSVVALLGKGGSAAAMESLLISTAAADVAREKIAAAAQAGQGLRPEHCIVGGKISSDGVINAVKTAVRAAFSAAKLPGGDLAADAIAGTISNVVRTKMATGFLGTEELVAVAMEAGAEAMWYIDGAPESKSAFVKALNVSGAINAIAAVDAPEDIEAVKTRIMQLGRDAELGPDGPDAAVLEQICAKLGYPLPPAAAVPLKAESLIAANETLKACSLEGLDQETRLLIAQTAFGAERLAHLIDTSPPAQLKTAEDIYNYLVPLIEQLEIPGKMRLTSGGEMGASTKGLSDTISNTRWIGGLGSISPTLTLQALAGRNAVFEIGFSSLGIEFSIGTEKKKSVVAGFGAAGNLGVREARGSIAVGKTFMGERAIQEGVKFMIPRSRFLEYSDDDVRLEAKKLLHILFHWPRGEGDAGAADTEEFPDELGGIPGRLGAILAACPHVSVAVLGKMSDTSFKQESAGGVGFKGAGTLTSRGQALGAGLLFGGKNTHVNWREYNISEQTGLANIERHNLAHGGQVAVEGVAGPAATAALLGQDPTNGLGASLSAVSTSRQTKAVGADVKLRLALRDGKIDPAYTRKEFVHAAPSTLRKKVEADRELWLQLGVEELFTEAERKDIPLEERRRFASKSLDAALKMCEESEKTMNGGGHLRNLFTESYSLRDGAASQLDGIRSEEALVDARIEKLGERIQALKKLGRDGAATAKKAAERMRELREQKAKLIDTQNALYRDDASWRPWRVGANERTYETVQQGADILVRAGGVDGAESQRPIFRWPH